MTGLFPPPQQLSPMRQAQIGEVIMQADRELAPPRRRWRWRVSLAGAATAATAAVAWLVTMGGGAPALAAWTAVPQHVPAGAAARIAASCGQQVAVGHFPIRLGGITSALAERRGASSAVLLAGAGRTEAICVDESGQASTGSAGAGTGPLVGIGRAGPKSGALTVDGVPGGAGIGARAVYGRVAPLVSKVLVSTQDGRLVTASVGHGHFLAWWPSGSGVATVRAFDHAGHLLAAMDEPRTGSGPPAPRQR